MPIDKRQLFDFLTVVDGELPRKIRLNAAGGTALTLLEVKSATIDVDFDATPEDSKLFGEVKERLKPGFEVDCFASGFIFSQQLPKDYLEKCVSIPSPFSRIELYSIAPIDVIVSKAGRLNERDIADIAAVISKYNLAKKEVKQRASQVQYAGNEKYYAENVKYILNKLFGEKIS